VKHKKSVLYIGNDDNYFHLITSTLSDFIDFLHFFKNNLSFDKLPDHGLDVILVDSEYKEPLSIIEAVRNAYTNQIEPYIVLLITPERYKDIKRSFSMRNYPDEISYKNTNTINLKNQILFSCECKSDFKEKTKNIGKFFTGNLNKDSYGKILFTLFRKKFTGKLIVESGIDKGIFSFCDGIPFDIKFNRLQCTLGRMLLRKGIIDEETYVKSLELMIEKKIRHGEALIELGVLKPSDLLDYIMMQKWEKLLFFFSRYEGTYKIINEKLSPELIFQKVDVLKLIYEGVKKNASLVYLEEKFLPFKKHYLAALENFVIYKDCIPFDNLELEFLDHIKETPQLIELLEKTSLSLNDALRLLEILHCCEMVKFCEDKETAKIASMTIDPKVIQLKEMIINDYVKMENKNYYEILGVKKDATFDEIKKAYISLVKVYHPDKFAHLPLPKDVMHKISSIFQKIQCAYDTLSDPSSRSSYDAALSSPDIKEMIDKTEAIVNAEISFKKGEVLLKTRKYKEAEKYFREAVYLNSKEPEYLLNLAICLLFQKKVNNDEYDNEAKKLLERVVYLNPYFDKGYYYLGVHSKLRGETKEAILYFKKALSINPDNKEALMELKSLEKF
jgi:DnaJ-domain-containing protein 1